MVERWKACWSNCASGSAKAPDLKTSSPGSTRQQVKSNHSLGGTPGTEAASENFPVGSWLLPARLRLHVFTFYNFARAADNIADSADLAPGDKIHHLERFERILLGKEEDPGGYGVVTAMQGSLAATRITSRHCLDLLAAFRQDATKDRYEDWADLIGYCRLSAAPVGRYMIDLHGGTVSGYGASDSLCMALQILNHIQDCGDDYRTLNRIYLPGDWMSEVGLNGDELAAEQCSPALRQVLDWALTGVGNLLADSPAMIGELKSTRLALESSVIIAIANALNKKLARNNPLNRRVVLDKRELMMSTTSGIVAGIWARL